jgi:hypothetical protein
MVRRLNLAKKFKVGSKPKKKAVPHGVPVMHAGVQLRSGLEKICYEALTKAGITHFNYEDDVFELQSKFTASGVSYQLYKRMMTYDEAQELGINARFKDKKKAKYVYQFGEVTNNLRAITIKPDFSCLDKDTKTGWIIETKGQATPEYLLKLRLFKFWWTMNGWVIDYFAPNNKTNVDKCIKLIKNKYYGL